MNHNNNEGNNKAGNQINKRKKVQKYKKACE